MVREVRVEGGRHLLLPKFVGCGVAKAHVVEPVPVPGVKLGGLDASDRGAECAVGSCAVHADEDSEVERGP